MLESDTRSKRVIAAGRITPGFTCTHHRATIGLNGECLLCGRTPTMPVELPRARAEAFTPMQAVTA